LLNRSYTSESSATCSSSISGQVLSSEDGMVVDNGTRPSLHCLGWEFSVCIDLECDTFLYSILRIVYAFRPRMWNEDPATYQMG
jgi:hypothetical protein